MSKFSKRTLIKMIGLSAVSVAALTACGKKEEDRRLRPHPLQPPLRPTS